MQHIAEQYGVEALFSDREMPSIVGQVIDASGRAVADVQSNYSSSQHASKMMRDKAIAASDIEYVSLRRQHSGNLERHVICSPNLLAPSHAAEATFYGCD
jgi:hypothetical protein